MWEQMFGGGEQAPTKPDKFPKMKDADRNGAAPQQPQQTTAAREPTPQRARVDTSSSDDDRAKAEARERRRQEMVTTVTVRPSPGTTSPPLPPFTSDPNVTWAP